MLTCRTLGSDSLLSRERSIRNNSAYYVTRALYIGNVLYTVSTALIKMNGLTELSAFARLVSPNLASQNIFCRSLPVLSWSGFHAFRDDKPSTLRPCSHSETQSYHPALVPCRLKMRRQTHLRFQ